MNGTTIWIRREGEKQWVQQSTHQDARGWIEGYYGRAGTIISVGSIEKTWHPEGHNPNLRKRAKQGGSA